MKPKAILETFCLLSLFLFSVYMWSLPIQKMPIPYGEVDEGHHYGISTYYNTADKVTEIFPNFIRYRYWGVNLKNKYEMAYPPHFFINMAVAEIIGGDLALSYYLFLSILDTLIIISLYFLIRKLWGFIPAFLAVFLVAFSKIDILTHIMGQYVVLISLAYLPLAIYCYYKYVVSYREGNAKIIYMILLAFCVAIPWLNHMQAVVDIALMIIVATLILTIKYRKLPFNLKHAAAGILALIIILGPFVLQPLEVKGLSFGGLFFFGKSGYFGEATAEYKSETHPNNLFKWYSDDFQQVSVGSDIFSYSKMHGNWTIVFMVLGLIFLILNRREKEIFIISWLVGIYILFHLDVFIGVNVSRMFRSISDVPYLFYSIIALGVFFCYSAIKLPDKQSKFIKYALIIIFLVLAINFNAVPSYKMLEGAYMPPLRMNSYQYEAALWVKDNTPEDSFFNIYGTLTQATKRHIRTSSQRYMCEDNDCVDDLIKNHRDSFNGTTHLFFDYTELVALNMVNDIGQLKKFEQNVTNMNVSLIYNKNNIRIYKFDNPVLGMLI